METKKIKGDRVFRLIFREWTAKDLTDYKAFHGHERNDGCKGLYHWIAENSIQEFLRLNPTAYLIKK